MAWWADEQQVFSRFEAIAEILQLYYDDPLFFPQPSYVELGFDPNSDGHKPLRMSRTERAAEWRLQVSRCFRCQTDLTGSETVWKRRYCTASELHGFFRYYHHRQFSPAEYEPDRDHTSQSILVMILRRIWTATTWE